MNHITVLGSTGSIGTSCLDVIGAHRGQMDLVGVTAHSRWEQLARQATASVGALVAGVDILPGLDGEHYLLEVNGVPGWKALARTLDVDVASMLLDLLVRQVVSAPCS